MSKDMLGSVVRAAVGVPQNRLDTLAKIASVMSEENPQGDLWYRHLKALVKNGLSEAGAEVENKILKLISTSHNILIDACDGMETLAEASEVFLSGIDRDFQNWGTNVAGRPTAETTVDVYEMSQDATFVQMFGSLGSDLDKLCMTQHQIKEFCKNHPNWLCQSGWATFFLFKENEQFFLAFVYAHSGGLDVGVRRFGRGNVWYAELLHRVVVPQMTA